MSTKQRLNLNQNYKRNQKARLKKKENFFLYYLYLGKVSMSNRSQLIIKQ